MSVQREARRRRSAPAGPCPWCRSRSSGRAARRTPASGANFSPNSVASLPRPCGTPRRPGTPTMPSPEASQNSGAATSYERRVLAAEGAHATRSCRASDLLHLVHRRVEQQRDVRLLDVTFSSRMVSKMSGLPSGLRYSVLDQDLVDHAALAGPAVVVAHVRGGAQDPQPHLAGGIAAQHRPVLDQHDLEARPRGRDGAAGARQAAADNGQVAGDFLGFWISFVNRIVRRSWFSPPVRGYLLGFFYGRRHPFESAVFFTEEG